MFDRAAEAAVGKRSKKASPRDREALRRRVAPQSKSWRPQTPTDSRELTSTIRCATL